MLNKIKITLFLFIFFLSNTSIYSLGNNNKAYTNGIHNSHNANQESRIMIKRGKSSRRSYTPFHTSAYFDSSKYLNTTGFLLTGINDEGINWTNGILPSYKSEDYVVGKINDSLNYPSIFYMSKDFIPFGEEWQFWKNAVELGAEFYDGNLDGKFDPIDHNNNGIWDEDEDRPPFYGDFMYWISYHDGVPEQWRRIKEVAPQGIKVNETIWVENSSPNLETTFFIKYTIENTGIYYSNHDSVYFSFFVDPDLSNGNNDLCGSNPSNNSVFFYDDVEYYFNRLDQLALTVSMIQGPSIKSNVDEDSAYLLEGESSKAVKINGSKNLDNISVWEFPQSSLIRDKDLLRDFIINGNRYDPCSNINGKVIKSNCNEINSQYLFSGNPILETGWLNTQKSNKHLFLTTGPFNLKSEESIEIIYSFSIGTGNTGLESLFDSNNKRNIVLTSVFEPPENLPKVNPIVITDESSIELIWETWPFVDYKIHGSDFELNFEGFNVYMFNSPNILDEIDGITNIKKIASFDIRNEIDKIYTLDANEFDTDVLYGGGEQLDYEIYKNEESGRLFLKITRDPFLNKALTKGRPYFLGISPFAINNKAIIPYGSNGSFIVNQNSSYSYIERPYEIISNNSGTQGIQIGSNINNPYYKSISLQHVAGNSEVDITYSVYDKESTTDDIYEVGFTRTEAELYELTFYIKNLTLNKYLDEGIRFGDEFNNVRNLNDGFLINVEWLAPGIKSVWFEGESKWFKDFNNLETGVFYVGIDMPQREKITPILPLRLSTAISADKLADVELIFGESSKAYRYLRRGVRYLWTGTENVNEGFLDIPVSAYRSNIDGSKTQLSMAFIENAYQKDSLAFPDLQWNPGSNITQSKEYLVVFNSEYSENYIAHQAYIGTNENPANIAHGYNYETENDSLKKIAKSPWFDALYVVGIEMEEYIQEFNPEGVLKIDANHILSTEDKYVFKVKKEADLLEKQESFDNINVFPNPLFAYNSSSSFYNQNPDDPFITFTNLPVEVQIKIFTLSGNLVKTIEKNDLSSTLQWNLLNESGRRIGSGMFLAVIENPSLGQKVLKFAVIMPQKRVHY